MGSHRESIFFVDDNIVNLRVGYDVLSEAYDVFTMSSGAKLFKMLERHTPDLILLDIEMPELNGYDTIKLLKAKDETKYIPVIFLTARSHGEDELQGLSLGAVDYIAKPFSPALLLKRIEMHLLVESQKKELEAQKQELIKFNSSLLEMVEAKTKAVVELQNAVMNTFAELIECRDIITGSHIGRTQEYLRILLEALQNHPAYYREIEKWDTMLILQSAQLHDVGKIAIKDSILQKPDKLAEEEYEIIKTHVAFGERIIEKIMSNTSERVFLEQARILVCTHHEKWDGTGYPKGLKGREIPLLGRMMAIVDVYDALISDRPYKKAYNHQDVVRIITEGEGTQFDPELIKVFLNVNEKFEAITLHDDVSSLLLM
ncbi:MAG: response regulator [Oscillospiraceae bacterium]|nr:response regulator [Oscillospiraceae bacterium]